MVIYKDFVPQQLQTAGFLRSAEYEDFDAAVLAANQWIEANGVEVVHYETVILPNIWSPYEQGSQDTSLRTPPDFASTWHQFVRIWYRKP